jgi:uncharacterized protein YueI
MTLRTRFNYRLLVDKHTTCARNIGVVLPHDDAVNEADRDLQVLPSNFSG